MMDELSYLAEISEKLDVVNNRLEIIIFIGIFAICIHYSEKWLKALLENIKRETGG